MSTAPGSDTSGPGWFAAPDLHRLLRIPRPSDDALDTMTDPFDLLRRAALVAANRAGHGDPVLTCWRRSGADAAVEVVVGGFGAAQHNEPGAGEILTELGYPIGSLGRPVARDEFLHQLSALPVWSTLAVADRPLSEEQLDAPDAGSRRPALEDVFAGVWTGAFALCVCAVPSAPSRVEEQISYAEAISRAPAGRGAAFDTDAATMRRRYVELRAGREEGFWQLMVAAGAEDFAAMTAVRALTGSTIELDGTRFLLRNDPEHGSFADVVSRAWSERSATVDVPSAVLARIARVPVREIPGVRARRTALFDVTPETSGPIRLGQVLDAHARPCGELTVNTDTLNRHTFVCGATGSGKSQTVRHLLQQVSRTVPALPWLVIEPAKAEYAGMAGRLDGPADKPVLRLRPGHSAGPAAGLNPLEPSAHPRTGAAFPLQTHIDLIRALFMAAFDAQEPFPQVLAAALTRCYTALGWDLVTGRPMSGLSAAPYPTLADLQGFARSVVDDIGYGQEAANNVRGFVDVRMNSLRLGTPGRVLEGAHPISIADLLERQVVVELEDVGDDQDKAFMIGIFLIRIVEHLRLTHQHGSSDAHLRHLLVIEEAHRLLRRGEGNSPANHAVELFAGLLAEIRAYGQGIVVVEQIPSKVLSDVVKNTALKIVHRLPAADDREAVGATMNLTEAQSATVVGLMPGRGVAFADGMDAPVLLAVPGEGRSRENAATATFDMPCRGSAFRLCRDTCGGTCTVTELQEARDRAADDVLSLWVETEAVRLVAGHDPARPHPGPLARLAGLFAMDPARMTCAVHQAAEHAVRARNPAIARFHDPVELLAELARGILQVLADPTAGAERTQRYVTGPFVLIPWQIQLAGEGLSHQQWRALHVDPAVAAAQPAAALAGAVGRPDIQALRPILIWGVGSDSRFEQAAGRPRTSPDYDRMLTAKLLPIHVDPRDVAAITQRVSP